MNRRFRLFAALGVAAALGAFILYLGIAGGRVGEPIVKASALSSQRKLASSREVELVGNAAKPITHGSGQTMSFYVTDAQHNQRIRVLYAGSVPDAFQATRQVVVRGRIVNGNFHAVRDSLSTKCPSKYNSTSGIVTKSASSART